MGGDDPLVGVLRMKLGPRAADEEKKELSRERKG